MYHAFATSLAYCSVFTVLKCSTGVDPGFPMLLCQNVDRFMWPRGLTRLEYLIDASDLGCGGEQIGIIAGNDGCERKTSSLWCIAIGGVIAVDAGWERSRGTCSNGSFT